MSLSFLAISQVRQCRCILIGPSINELFMRYSSTKENKPLSPRMQEFKKKLRETTSIGKLEEISGNHPYQEKEPLEGWPDNTNPVTGEVGGPRGPEPTRYGDWERKGRVTDF
jgi:hypothetical protein